MTSLLFDLSFLVAAPFWALMILAPGWSVTTRIVSSPLILLPVLVVYLILTVPLFPQLWAAVVQPSLDGLIGYLADPAAVASTWAQIIAWDLFIGRWIYLRVRELGLHPLVTSPLLVVTVLISPFAFLAFLAIRAVRSRRMARRRSAEDGAALPAASLPAD